jgi:peptide/nickel transport system substrate-binding protein
MEIWLPELPNVQVTEWYHHIPMNTTYWQGWPTEEDPYVNGAFWHLTFPLILNRLKPAQ